MQEGNISLHEIDNLEIVEQKIPECEVDCELAKSLGHLAAANEAIENCSGPEEIKVCGAPEGMKTYSCPIKLTLVELATK